MLRLAVPPDVVTFNTLIRGLCVNSRVREAFGVFRLMAGRGCEPDVVSYNTLLDGLVRVGRLVDARELFDEMRRRSDVVFSPNVVSYTTLIRGYCRRLMVDEAVGLLGNMLVVGLKPNGITFNTLMKGFCEAGKFDLMRVFFDKKIGFEPDVCSFNTLIAAYCNAGNVDDAVKVFEGLNGLGMRADSSTYSSLIRGLCFGWCDW